MKELKEQLHSVQQLLNRKNVEMELKYEEQKKWVIMQKPCHYAIYSYSYIIIIGQSVN